jgi:pectate lyase
LVLKSVLLLLLVISMQAAWAQERTVTGKVIGQKEGFALPGVSVLLKGTTTGSSTDSEGNYTLKDMVFGCWC